MMFLDCPAYLDQDGAARCGLPAEVRYRFTMHSTGRHPARTALPPTTWGAPPACGSPP